jgi:FG-GAP-like repeat
MKKQTITAVITHLVGGAFFVALLFLVAQAMPLATAACSSDYTFVAGTGTIVPGTTDIGNHCDDCTTSIPLPFTYQLYGQSFTGANISSNGTLQFVSNSNSLDNACLPTATFNFPIMPHWDDLRTDQVSTGCTGYASGCGVFTSATGAAPNRIFNIEWRTVYFEADTTRANFEVRLYEGQNRFDLIYGEIAQGGASATVGVQKDTGSQFTQYECNTAGALTAGLQVVATEPCATPPPPPGGCGLLVGSGLAIGYAPNNFGYLATNLVNYTFARSQSAPNQFALFQTHDPWSSTVVKDAITGAGYTYTVFTPAQLTGFNFSSYRVVILNWDDHFVTDFNTAYSANIAALQAYVNAGGVVWVQGAIQGSSGVSFPMPFGGAENWDLSGSDFIVDTASLMVDTAPNPVTGNFASHGSYSSLPTEAHIVMRKTDANGPAVLYEISHCSSGMTFNNRIANAGFEPGSFSPWVINGTNPPPVITTAQHHSGTHSALLGTVSGPEPVGEASIYQQITVPGTGGILSYWWWGGTADTISSDWQDSYVTDTSGNVLATISHTCENTSGWVHETFDLTPYAGQTVRIKFLVHQNGTGNDTWMYVDDVELIWPNANYVLSNANTRSTAVWRLNNKTLVSSGYGPTLPPGWGLVSGADFNGSLNPDYLLFNASTGQSAIWYLSGTTFISGAYGPTLPSGWVLVTTADFNRDRHPDYVLYNSTTRQTAIWYLNNNVFTGGAYGPTLPAGWSLVGVADFNGNGNPDYLLFNASTGQSAIWYLSGTTFISGAYGPTLPSGWVLVTTADFNRDRHPDYLLYNSTTRQTAIWYLNNNLLTSGGYGPTLPTGWSLKGALPSVP